MTMTQGDGGGGGLGTAGSICTISPADNEAIINNLIARIEKLEFDLSQITGANLHAGTLGDLSSQVGWVYGVEYMGVPGWTQTEYGTLIPPAGFTLSGSGFQMFNACTGEYEDYQGVQMDSDGVLQFGFTSSGNVCGAKVQYWDQGGAASGTPTGIPAYADVGWHQNVLGIDILKNVSIVSRSRGAGIGNIKLTVSAVGKYLVIGNATQYVSAGLGTPGAIINGYLTLAIAPTTLLAAADTSAVISTAGVAREAASVHKIFDITSITQQIELGWQSGILDGSCTFPNPDELSIQVIGIGV